MLLEARCRGRCALHAAAELGQHAAIDVLTTDASFPADVRDHRGNTPFHLAGANGHVQCLQVLMRLKPELLDMRNDAGSTALHGAAYRSQV
jgi:ankyrin repeat protein